MFLDLDIYPSSCYLYIYVWSGKDDKLSVGPIDGDIHHVVSFGIHCTVIA